TDVTSAELRIRVREYNLKNLVVFARRLLLLRSVEFALFATIACSSVAETPLIVAKTVEADEAFRRSSGGRCEELERKLLDLAFSIDPIPFWRENDAARLAVQVVSPISRARRSLISSIAPFSYVTIPGNKSLTSTLVPSEVKMAESTAGEHFSKVLLLRSQTDVLFREDYIHTVLWSGKFIRRQPGGSSRQEIQTTILLDGLTEEGAFSNEIRWRNSLRLFLLSELLG
ncbi:MAG: hypothetical protein AAF989_11915, partial [Planctomycetota bacterium]